MEYKTRCFMSINSCTDVSREYLFKTDDVQTKIQKHIPKEFFSFLIEKKWIDKPFSLEITKTFQNPLTHTIDRFDLCIGPFTDGRESVTITYMRDKALPNSIKGFQVGYQEGVLLGVAFFDSKGRDYVSTPDATFTKEENRMTEQDLLRFMREAI